MLKNLEYKLDLNKLLAKQILEFRYILGCLAFSEFVFAKNKTVPRPNHFKKKQWWVLVDI